MSVAAKIARQEKSFPVGASVSACCRFLTNGKVVYGKVSKLATAGEGGPVTHRFVESVSGEFVGVFHVSSLKAA